MAPVTGGPSARAERAAPAATVPIITLRRLSMPHSIDRAMGHAIAIVSSPANQSGAPASRRRAAPNPAARSVVAVVGIVVGRVVVPRRRWGRRRVTIAVAIPATIAAAVIRPRRRHHAGRRADAGTDGRARRRTRPAAGRSPERRAGTRTD